jgi:hypothetical protein
VSTQGRIFPFYNDNGSRVGLGLSNQLLSCVDKKNGLLGRELKKGFAPLQPQPDPASIVVVKRKYSTLMEQ